MAIDAFIVTYFDGSRVDETDAGDGAQAVRHEVGKHWHCHLTHALNKSIVTGDVGEVASPILLQKKVKMPECAVVTGLKSNEDGHDFTDA